MGRLTRDQQIESLEKKIEKAENKIADLKAKLKIWKSDLKRLEEEEQKQFFDDIMKALVESGKSDEEIRTLLQDFKNKLNAIPSPNSVEENDDDNS